MKKMKKITLLLLIILFSLNNTFSQGVLSKSDIIIIEENLGEHLTDNDISNYGDYFFETNQYHKALEHYLPAFIFNSYNNILSYKIGKSYYYLNDIDNAKKYLLLAYNNNDTVTIGINGLLARTYHLDNNFNKAISYYKQAIYDTAQAQMTEEEILRYIEQCKNGIVLQENINNLHITELSKSINTDYPEYSVVILNDTSMFFTARRNSSTGKFIDIEDNMYFEDIYFSQKEHGKWTGAKNYSLNMNTLAHDVVLGISPNKEVLFLYRNKGNNGDIYYTYKSNEKWIEPKPFSDLINSQYTENSFTITEDSKEIFFTAYRDTANLEQSDIYTSKLTEQGRWTKPEKISEKLNTIYDEYSVFVEPDGKTLYFSSKGHNSIGAYDIFVSKRDEDGSWNSPKNMGIPINSPYDDFFYSKYGTKAYFSTTRKGNLHPNIFEIDYNPKRNNEIIQNNNQIAQNYKYENINRTNDDNKTVEIVYVNNPINTNPPINRTNPVVNSSQNVVYNTKPVRLLTPSSTNFEQLKANSIENDCVVENFIFSCGSPVITQNTEQLNTLAKFLINNKDCKIIIKGYASLENKAIINKKLSKKRANNVANYLINKGVAEDAIETRALGILNPIAFNLVAGKLNEASMQYNRRIEFEVSKKGVNNLYVKQIYVPEEFRTENYKNCDRFTICLYKGDENAPENIKQIGDTKTVKLDNQEYAHYYGEFFEIENTLYELKNIRKLVPEAFIVIIE